MKHYIPIYIILLFCNPVLGQKGKIERANHSFQQKNYNLANLLYKEVLAKSKNKDELSFSFHYCLAYSSMKTGDFELAYDAFQRIKEELIPDSYYNHDYAQCLIALGKYEEAKQQIIKYFNYDKYYYSRYIDFIDDIANQRDATVFKSVEQKLLLAKEFQYDKVRNDLNRSLFFYQNGLFINDDVFYDYDTIKENYLLFDASWNTRINFSPHHLTTSKKKTIISSYLLINNYFGRTDPDDLVSKLYECKSKDGTYEAIKGLPINSDDYHVSHPSLNATGDTLYFSSDMPGGFGGLDLYYIVYDFKSESWETPINLGPSVNTLYDEKNSFFDQSSYKLYFSSDGHPGYGLSDIYVLNQQVGEELLFPINLGKNINSNQDDFGFILNKMGNRGFMYKKEKHNTQLYELLIKP